MREQTGGADGWAQRSLVFCNTPTLTPMSFTTTVQQLHAAEAGGTLDLPTCANHLPMSSLHLVFDVPEKALVVVKRDGGPSVANRYRHDGILKAHRYTSDVMVSSTYLAFANAEVKPKLLAAQRVLTFVRDFLDDACGKLRAAMLAGDATTIDFLKE